MRCCERVKCCVTRDHSKTLIDRELRDRDAVYGLLLHKFIAPAKQNVGTAADELLHNGAGAAIVSRVAEACGLWNAVIGAAQDLFRAFTAAR